MEKSRFQCKFGGVFPKRNENIAQLSQPVEPQASLEADGADR